MAMFDFATVQVYCMDDLVEVSFPFDRDFGTFLGTMKGRWAPQRKAWQITTASSGLSIDEIVARIEERLRQNAPDKWDKIIEVMRTHGCVYTKYEVFAGLGGVRLKIPAGHPCHHYLKSVPHGENDKKVWRIPARSFKHEVMQSTLKRLWDEDFKKYRELLEPVAERGLIGRVALPAEQEEAYGMKKGALIAITPTFLRVADPAMADTPVREIAFEVVKMERRGDADLKVTLEYAEPEEGYEMLKRRVYDKNCAPALDHSHHLDDKWIQRRL